MNTHFLAKCKKHNEPVQKSLSIKHIPHTRTHSRSHVAADPRRVSSKDRSTPRRSRPFRSRLARRAFEQRCFFTERHRFQSRALPRESSAQPLAARVCRRAGVPSHRKPPWTMGVDHGRDARTRRGFGAAVCRAGRERRRQRTNGGAVRGRRARVSQSRRAESADGAAGFVRWAGKTRRGGERGV